MLYLVFSWSFPKTDISTLLDNISSNVIDVSCSNSMCKEFLLSGVRCPNVRLYK